MNKYLRGFMDTAKTGSTHLLNNTLYVKTATGEVQIDLSTGSVVEWELENIVLVSERG